MIFDIGDVQGPPVLRICAHEPVETVLEAEDFHPLVARLESGGTDDAINPRRRAAADQQGQLAAVGWMTHVHSSLSKVPVFQSQPIKVPVASS
jgi:hypothetical protein